MADRTCTVTGCAKPVKSKDMCSQHYQRAWRGVPLIPQHPTHCATCLAALPSPPYGKVGATYCSSACRPKPTPSPQALAARREETASRRRATTKVCPECNSPFTPQRSMAQRFCTKRCGRRWQAANSPKRCEVDDCDRPHAAKGMCQMHWRRAARAEGREVAPGWDDRRRHHYHARRARMKATAVGGDPVLLADIADRDGWTCHICRESVAPDLEWPDPKSPSLDHVVPLSRGGAHSPENVSLAHLTCNVSKGDRLVA